MTSGPVPVNVMKCPNCKGLVRCLSRLNSMPPYVPFTHGGTIQEFLFGAPDLLKCSRCSEVFCWFLTAEIVDSYLRGMGDDSLSEPGIFERALDRVLGLVLAPPDVPFEWRRAPYLDEPAVDEAYDALDSFDFTCKPSVAGDLYLMLWWAGGGMINLGRQPELYLRIRAWRRKASYWPTNNPPKLDLGRGFFNNLERIVVLLTGDRPETVLLKAEALRQLGRFTEAAQLLEPIVTRDWDEADVSGINQKKNRQSDLKQAAAYIYRLTNEKESAVRIVS